MTVTSNDILVGPLAGPGVGPFSYTTYVAMESELVVTKQLGTTDTELVWIDDYTVDLDEKQVTLNVALTGDELLYIEGNPEPTQGDVPTTQPHFLEVAEARADRITRRQQRVQSQLDRMLKKSIGSTADVTLPPVVDDWNLRPVLLAEVNWTNSEDFKIIPDVSLDDYDWVELEVVKITEDFAGTGGFFPVLRFIPLFTGTDLGTTNFVPPAFVMDVDFEPANNAGAVTRSSGGETIFSASESTGSFLWTYLVQWLGTGTMAARVLYNMENRFGFVTATGNEPVGGFNASCTDSCFRIDDDTIGRLIGFRWFYLGTTIGDPSTAHNGLTTGTARMWGIPKV